MIDWAELQTKQNELVAYDSDWNIGDNRKTLSELLSTFISGSFDWITDSLQGRYSTIEEQRRDMLAENPGLSMQGYDDGFQLEADRLIAIQQKNSRGFTIIDINPGLLDRLQYPLTLPYEFLFDGTNFLPSVNQSIVRNFRTVNIPIQGNFVKIEYIYENNSTANVSSSGIPRPYAARKYKDIVTNEQDLTTGQTTYTFDNFARTKTFINFSSVTEKPIILKRSGDSFTTWFNELNIHLNIGSPKIRITIGMNSSIQDGPSNDAINSKMALTGGARLFADSDTVLSPFSICEQDNLEPVFNTNIIYPSGVNVSLPLIFNPSLPTILSVLPGGLGEDFLGYSVFWISSIRFKIITSLTVGASTIATLRFSLVVANPAGTELSRVHTATLMNAYNSSTTGVQDDQYVWCPSEPVRVVLPARSSLNMVLTTTASAASAAVFNIAYNIEGYSLGEILAKPFAPIPGSTLLETSKFVTDATFLSDYNRIENIRKV